MAVAKARSAHDQVVQRVIILLDRIARRVNMVVAQCVQFQELDSNVCHFQQFHHLKMSLFERITSGLFVTSGAYGSGKSLCNCGSKTFRTISPFVEGTFLLYESSQITSSILLGIGPSSTLGNCVQSSAKYRYGFQVWPLSDDRWTTMAAGRNVLNVMIK